MCVLKRENHRASGLRMGRELPLSAIKAGKMTTPHGKARYLQKAPSDKLPDIAIFAFPRLCLKQPSLETA